MKLVLSVAVNCNEKEHYITQIMEMEESIQQYIYKALQDIEGSGKPTSGRSSLNLQPSENKDDREQLAQKLHEKEILVNMMYEEKQALLHENQRLLMTLEKYENPTLIGDDGASLGAPLQGSVRMNEIRKQVENLKNDLVLSESVKEDLKMKSIQQEREISTLHMKIDELTKASSELSQIKDEVDILREASEKCKDYERQINVYKKRLEETADLKRQNKLLEDRNAEYLKQNLQYEEDAKRFSTLKGQVELYKKELEDLHVKLDSEMQKTVKAEFDLQVMQTKIAGLQRERDNLLVQRDSLQEKVDELRCNQTSDDDDSANMSRELLDDNLKEKNLRLEAENKALREGQGGQTALSELLNDANQRNEKLREQLKATNQKILFLTSQTSGAATAGEDEKIKSGILELSEQRERLLEEAQNQIANLHSRIRQIETSLESKGHDYNALELKYKKCVEKAKEVIKGIDPRLLNEEGAISEPPEEHDRMSPMESKLIVAAFYRMALNQQRENVDSKLATLSQGQSFLARQRQPAPRKPVVNYKK